MLRGRPTLRTPDGERQLDEGEVVYFPTGPEGAHGLTNRTPEPVRFLVAGTRPTPELVEYPDLGQLRRSPPNVGAGDPLFVIHQLVDPPGD